MSKEIKEKKRSLSSIEETIKDLYGDVLFSATNLKEVEGQIIPTTLNLDIALNGGIAEGTITTISGVSGSGKTTLCLEIIANAQKMGKPVFYLDVEGRLRLDLLTTVKGLDLDKLTIVRSNENKLLWAEDYLNLLEQIIRDVPRCLIILDSAAALCSTAASDTPLGESKQMMAIPKMLYDNLRKAAQILPVRKSNLIVITHLQANPSSYGGPTEVGGNALKYLGSNRLMCNSSQEFPKDETRKEGRESVFKILKSALGPPGNATIFVRYGHGCDKYLDLFRVSEEMGLIDKRGAWYTFPQLKGYEDKKLQGQDNVLALMHDDPAFFNLLDKTVRDLVFGSKK